MQVCHETSLAVLHRHGMDIMTISLEKIIATYDTKEDIYSNEFEKKCYIMSPR